MNSNPSSGKWPLSGSLPRRPGAFSLGAIRLAIGLFAVSLFATACGQRGPLFLPDEKTATPPAVEVEQESVENSPNLQEEEDDDEEMPGT